MIALECRFRGDRLGVALRIDLAVVDAAGKPPQSAALGAELSHQLDLVGALQVADRAIAELVQLALERWSDAEDEAHRLVGQERVAVFLVQHRKATWLV